ncbi:hypothetical protein ACCS33_39015, partial [Rhizobium ruizarguesonis]
AGSALEKPPLRSGDHCIGVLTRAGYDHTAPLLGEVAHTDSSGRRSTLIIVQGAIRNQGDAWNWMLNNLRR